MLWTLAKGDWLVALIIFVSLATCPLVRSEAVSPEKSPQPHAQEKTSAVKAAPPSPGSPQGSASSTPPAAPDTSKPATGPTKEGKKGYPELFQELLISYTWPSFFAFLLLMLNRKGHLGRILDRLVEMLGEVSPTKVGLKGVTLEFERAEKVIEITPMSPFRMGDDDRQNGPSIILGLKSTDIIPEFVTQLEFQTSELATESVRIEDKDRVKAKMVELEAALSDDHGFREKLWEFTQVFEKARFYESKSFAKVLNNKANLHDMVSNFPEPQRRFIMHCVGAAYVRSGETSWEEKAAPYLKPLVEKGPLYPPAVDDYLTCEYHHLIKGHRTFDASFVRAIENFGQRMQKFEDRIDPSESRNWSAVVDDDGNPMIQNSEWFYFYQYLRGVPVILSSIAENLPTGYRDLRTRYLKDSIEYYRKCQNLKAQREVVLYEDYLLENNLADLHRAMGDSESYEKALEILKSAIKREKRPILFRTLAEVYQKMGENQDALKAIRSSRWEDIDQEHKDDISEYVENKIFEATLLFYQLDVPKRSRVDKGIKALQEALDVMDRYFPDGKKELRRSILEKLGYLYAEIENWKKSFDNYRDASKPIMALIDSVGEQFLSEAEAEKALRLVCCYFSTKLRLAERLFFDHDVDGEHGARQHYIELIEGIAGWQKYIKEKLEGRIEISEKYSDDLDRMARSAHLGAGECFRQRYVLHWAEEDFVKATDYLKKVFGYGGPLERRANWELGGMYLEKARIELKSGVQTAQTNYYRAVNYLEHAAQHSGDTGIFKELSEVYKLEKRFTKVSSKDKT